MCVYHDRVLLLRHSVYMNPVTQQFRDAYAPDELAKILRVKTSTVYAWISRGELQSNKTGYSRSISSTQLQNFIASRNSGKYNFALEHIR